MTMQSLAAAMGEPLEKVQATYADWEQIEDETGWLLVKGTEVHVCCKPGCRGRMVTRRKIREVLGSVFERLGFLTTRVLIGDPATVVRRLGFKKTWSNELFDHYILTAMPYSKEK